MNSNRESYNYQPGPPPPPGPTVNFERQRPPPPTGPPLHMQNDYIPQGSFPNQAQEWHPSPPGRAFHQPMHNTFHSHTFLQPDFTRPPPSHSHGNYMYSASTLHKPPELDSEFQEQQYVGYKRQPNLTRENFNYKDGRSLADTSSSPHWISSTSAKSVDQVSPSDHMKLAEYGCGDLLAHKMHVEDTDPTLPTCSDTSLYTFSHGLSNLQADSYRLHPTKGVETLVDFSNVIDDEDSKWFRDFEDRIILREKYLQENVIAKTNLKLSDVQNLVTRASELTEKLCQLKKGMDFVCREADDKQWNDLVTQAESVKAELEEITWKFQTEDFVSKVKWLICQRRKKRERSRRQRRSKVKERRDLNMKWKKVEEDIDAWRTMLQAKEEEKRREIAIKNEADSILCEVRQKQVDGVKMQQLLESLVSLRIARFNKRAAHGHVSTPQQDQLFSSTLSKIAEVVKCQMKEYHLEEQTLRVMMEESTSYKRGSAGRESKDTVNKLETQMKKIFFSNRLPINNEAYEDFTAADNSVKTLLQRR
ncbi:hypothetical protein SK128_011442 [Halocaridina rubra]|uniref:Programmed cell death protein 7 n=1 Tax=Halocaridina rubra TaxID=373956 RepID=A0AAN8XE73_HALRR